MANLVIVVGCLLLGLGLARTRLLPENAPTTLNVWVLYVALPALVVAKLGGIQPGWSAVVPAAMAWVQFFLVGGLVAAIGSWLRWDRRLRAAVTLAAGMGNTAFVGLPLIRALVGDAAIPTAIFADQLGTFLVFSTLGLALADWGTGAPVRIGTLALGVLKFPAAWAMVIGLLVPVPTVLHDALDRVGDTLTPLALVSVGLQLRFRAEGDPAPVWIGLLLKLLVAPCVLLALYLALGVRGQTLEVSILQCAMAPMTTAAIIAVERDLAPSVANRLVGFGVPLSLVTVPLWAALLGWLQGPR